MASGRIGRALFYFSHMRWANILGGDRRRGKIWPDRELQGGDTIVFIFHNHSGVDRGHHNRDLTDGTGQGLGSLDQSVGEGDSV